MTTGQSSYWLAPLVAWLGGEGGAALLSLSLETRTLKGYMGGLGLVTMLGHLQDKQDVKTIWGRRMRQQQEKSMGVRPCDLQE